MRLGTGLLVAALTLFVATFTTSASSATSGAADGLTAAPPATSTDYVGSAACARCHQDDYDQWKRSLHVRMTKPIAEAEVIGDFAPGTKFAAHGRSFELGRAEGKPFMRVSFGGRAPEMFSVDFTLGFKRYQGYLSMLSDGRMYVLPAFWHIESKRWLDWKEITPIPDGAHDLRQIWNTNCFNCHATNLAQGFDVATRKYNSTWTEMGIGCEACHGPGRRHVELIDAARKDPSLKPGGTLDTYFSPNGSPRQSFDTCAYCHGNKQNVFDGFRAGERYEDYALPFLVSAPIPETDRQGEFWPDGRPSRFNRPQALMMSGCFKAGEVACTSCHLAHGSPNPFSLKVDVTNGRDGDQLCTQCHRDFVASAQRPALSSQPSAESGKPTAVDAHTFHAASSEGSRCINCHMSDVNWRLLIRRRDHTFQAPVPELTAAFGAPNACTTCHDDRSPEWAAKYMDQWWGNSERRQSVVRVADAMYRAGSGDATVLPELARLAVDRTQSALIRASAVEFMEQLALGTAGAKAADNQTQTGFAQSQAPGLRPQAPGLRPQASGPRPQAPSPRAQASGLRGPAKLTAAQINALIGAAADPEPVVRAHAVAALLATGESERITAPLTARLLDPARIVRARTAEALLSLGIAELPGAAGALLTRAQDEYAASLRDFPDAPANHTALGWLAAERRQMSEANDALDTAIRLAPTVARPHVLKGVIAAREGRFADAAELWRKARSLDPAYPNIDQLISEADRRRP